MVLFCEEHGGLVDVVALNPRFEVGHPSAMVGWPGSVRVTRRRVLSATRGATWRILRRYVENKVCPGEGRGFVVR